MLEKHYESKMLHSRGYYCWTASFASNESDAKRKKRRRNRDPYDYLPGSPAPEGPFDTEIRRALHWDNMLRKESEQHLRSGAQKQQKTKSF